MTFYIQNTLIRFTLQSLFNFLILISVTHQPKNKKVTELHPSRDHFGYLSVILILAYEIQP